MNRIRLCIDSSDKTIKQISNETGINYTTLTNYYRGERNPRNTETWNILADYFHVPVSYLMGINEANSKIEKYGINQAKNTNEQETTVKLIDELKEENTKLKEKIKYYECLFDGIESLLNSRKIPS